MPKITVNNAEIYYEQFGQGQPVILIAGFTCDHHIWDPVVEELSKHFQVIKFDNRGVGQTQDNALLLTAELMAQDVIALSRALGLQKPHIVGQSMGGTIAQVIASQYPDEISKLAILTSAAKWRTAMLKGLQSSMLMRMQDIDFDLIFAVNVPWVFGENFLSNPENLQTLKQLFLENPYPQSLEDQIRQFHVLEAFDGTAYLEKIKAPTLVVHGKQDIIAMRADSENLAKKIPHAKLVEVDAAHAVLIETPQEISQNLIEFLSLSA
jgi:3-oxoadipate enol-lactonase